MYQTVILEDDRLESDAIAEMIGRSPLGGEMAVAQVPDVAQLESFMCDNGAPDILLADIVLGDGGMNGIDAVRDLLPQNADTQVIYITGYAEYCVPVYETRHIYFLLKPVDQATFDKAMKRAADNLKEAETQTLAVSFKGKTDLVDVCDIQYVESRLRKVSISTSDGVYETYATIDDILKRLPASFVQVHRSFLVNMDLIANISADAVVLKSGATIPIGQRFGSSFKKSVAEHYGI